MNLVIQDNAKFTHLDKKIETGKNITNRNWIVRRLFTKICYLFVFLNFKL